MALDGKTICPANRENVHSIKNPNYNNKTSDMPPETLLVVRYFLLTGCWFCCLLEAATRGVEAVLKNFALFTEKYQCWSLFAIKAPQLY